MPSWLALSLDRSARACAFCRAARPTGFQRPYLDAGRASAKAFAMLSKASQFSNRKLRDLAEEIVTDTGTRSRASA